MQNQEFIVQRIRSQYTETEHTKLDDLKALDAKVKKPANIFAYTYGSIGAMVMGSGMSLVMTDIGDLIGMGDSLVPGIVIGVAGMAMALTTYPIYKRILSARKKKFAPQILELSERIVNG
jgi:isocitrate dehydrogenase kinase/phosphatase